MRTIPALCAVALSCALTSPASSAPPQLDFARGNWDVVVPSQDAIRSLDGRSTVKVSDVCKGTLVASKADVNGQSKSWSTTLGWNTRVPLTCVTLAAGNKATEENVDPTVLELTVYGPFGGEKQYVLNRGHNNPSVAVREPVGNELTYQAPKPEPSKPGEPGKKPTQPGKKPTQPGKKPTQPGKKPTEPKKPGEGVALSALELTWLLPPQRADYLKSVDPAAKKPAAELAQAYAKARTLVAANLPTQERRQVKNLQADYNNLVKAGTFDKIDDLLEGKSYSGPEVRLDDKELEALKAVVKTAKEHSDWDTDNGALQYKKEMSPITDPNTGRAFLEEHLLAHQITDKFRKLIPAAKPGPGPVTPPAGIVEYTDQDMAKLTQEQRDAYHKAWKDAKTEDDKRKLNEQYAKLIKDAGGTPPAKPGEPLDPSKIKTKDDFRNLTPDKQQAFCKDSTVRKSMASELWDECYKVLGEDKDGKLALCRDAVAQTGGPTNANLPDGLVKEAKDKIDPLKAIPQKEAVKNGVYTDVKPQGLSIEAPPQPAAPTISSALQAQCAEFLKNWKDEQAHKGDPAKGGGDLKTTPPPNPDSKDQEPKKDEKKSDPNFYSNLAQGVTFGLAGLILGSFFGGPLVMLAVAAAAGVGAYMLSKSINTPKDDSKK